MSPELPPIPAGSGKHPVALVVITANRLAASGAFYSKLFGWQLQAMSAELAAGLAPAGPMVALRANVPEGAPGVVPYIAAPDVDAMLARVVAAGGKVERAPWSIPVVGMLARFTDPSGTVWGLTSAAAPGGAPHVPAPFGSNPRPPAGAVCSLEMHASADDKAAFFGGLFGWSTLDTMPHYTMFDAGAGIGGVFQSHTPALPALAYLYAADVPGKLAEIEAAGGKGMGQPTSLPGMGCFGYFTDPSGTTMGLIGPQG